MHGGQRCYSLLCSAQLSPAAEAGLPWHLPPHASAPSGIASPTHVLTGSREAPDHCAAPPPPPPPWHLASWDPQPCPLCAETVRLLGVLCAKPGSSVWVGAGRLWAHSDGSRSQGHRPAFARSSAFEGWLICPLAS